MSDSLDDSWNRLPQVKVRMRENGIETILDGLGEDGFCHAGQPRIHHLDDGIYVDILLNVGKYGSVVALPLEIFIPVEETQKSKKKSKVVKLQEDQVDAEFDQLVEEDAGVAQG